MNVVGRKWKNGIGYARFGCTAHHSRGPSVCSNGWGVSEKKASRALVGALRSKLDRPELVDRFVSTFRERVASAAGGQGHKDETDRRVRDCERRIANLTESLAKIGWSDALAAKLREEESQLARLKAERTAAAKAGAPRAVPHPTVIAGYFKNLLALLETDSVRGREVLSRFVAPIVMTPEGEGPARRYRATGAFNLAFFMSPAGLEPVGVVVKSSCAGPIADLYTRHQVPLLVRTQRQPDRRHLPETWRRRTA